jgi:Protein of unknown function (DUF2815)
MATTTTNANPYKITTGKGRLCYTKNVLTPDEKDSYSLMLLIPKTDTVTVNAIKKSVEAYKKDPKAVAKWGGKWLDAMKQPLRDGDAERDTDKSPEFKGHYFINANTYTKPGVVDAGMQEIINAADLYSGCYGRISIVPAAFNTDGNKGIKFYLNNVQKLAEGEKLGGGASNPNDDFTAVEDDFLS